MPTHEMRSLAMDRLGDDLDDDASASNLQATAEDGRYSFARQPVLSRQRPTTGARQVRVRQATTFTTPKLQILRERSPVPLDR